MNEISKITRIEPAGCVCQNNTFSFYVVNDQMLMAVCGKCGKAYGVLIKPKDVDATEAAREEYEKATGANVQFTPEEKEKEGA